MAEVLFLSDDDDKIKLTGWENEPIQMFPDPFFPGFKTDEGFGVHQTTDGTLSHMDLMAPLNHGFLGDYSVYDSTEESISFGTHFSDHVTTNGPHLESVADQDYQYYPSCAMESLQKFVPDINSNPLGPNSYSGQNWPNSDNADYWTAINYMGKKHQNGQTSNLLKHWDVTNVDYVGSFPVDDQCLYSCEELQSGQRLKELKTEEKTVLPGISTVMDQKPNLHISSSPLPKQKLAYRYAQIVKTNFNLRCILFGSNNGTKTSFCNLCNNFSNSQHTRGLKEFMRRHLFSHLKMNPHACGICGKCNTTNPGKVRSHIRRKHQDVHGFVDKYLVNRIPEMDYQLSLLAKQCYGVV